jgi:hypothetical protein
MVSMFQPVSTAFKGLCLKREDVRISQQKTDSSAIGLDPNSPLSHYGRGAAKYFLSDFRGALSDMNTALAFNKEFAKKSKAYFVRGVCKLNLGQIDGGCLDLSKAGELGFGDAYDLIREHCN